MNDPIERQGSDHQHYERGRASALNSGRADKLKSTFAKLAVLVRGTEPALVGSDAVAAAYGEAFKQIHYKVSFSPEQREQAGDMVIERRRFDGTLNTLDDKVSVSVSGKYFQILKRQASDWRFWKGSWTFSDATATSCDATGARSCCKAALPGRTMDVALRIHFQYCSLDPGRIWCHDLRFWSIERDFFRISA